MARMNASAIGAVAVLGALCLPAAASAQAGTCKVRVKLAEPAAQEVVIPVTWKR